jgi:hypothetical protein
MKTILNFFLLMFLFVTNGFSQDGTKPSPNTETAYLNYDYNFQNSGFEGVERQFIYIKAGEKLNTYFTLDPDYDYIFIACADSTTGGTVIKGIMGTDTSGIFKTDSSFIYKEYKSKILVYNLPEKLNGTVDIVIRILGKVNPVEPTYYMMYRKKAVY